MRRFIGLCLLFCVMLSANGLAGSVPKASLKFSGKKGACFTLRDLKSKKGGDKDQNLRRVKALNVSWNYSWNTAYVSGQPNTIEFVPMVWGGRSAEKLQQRLTTDVSPQIKAGKVKRLLVFNEPDRLEQANMPYKQALDYWPMFESLNIPLCSPSCASTEGKKDASSQGTPGTWMRDFMREVEKRKLRVDYIGVHNYGGPNAKSFKAKMKRIYEMYGRRPLLLTEFACADWQARESGKNRHSQDEVLTFMKDVLPWMEKQDWIVGYAWFSFSPDKIEGTSSALFDKDDKMTACGKFYASVTPETPEGDQSIKPDGK